MEEQLKNIFGPFNLEWVATFQNRLLPPFNMVKAKHNNRTKVNVKGSGIETFVSKGRIKQNPYGYKCHFVNEQEGSKVQKIFSLFGLCPALQSFPEVSIEITFSEAKELIPKIEKNNSKE